MNTLQTILEYWQCLVGVAALIFILTITKLLLMKPINTKRDEANVRGKARAKRSTLEQLKLVVKRSPGGAYNERARLLSQLSVKDRETYLKSLKEEDRETLLKREKTYLEKQNGSSKKRTGRKGVRKNKC